MEVKAQESSGPARLVVARDAVGNARPCSDSRTLAASVMSLTFLPSPAPQFNTTIYSDVAYG